MGQPANYIKFSILCPSVCYPLAISSMLPIYYCYPFARSNPFAAILSVFIGLWCMQCFYLNIVFFLLSTTTFTYFLCFVSTKRFETIWNNKSCNYLHCNHNWVHLFDIILVGMNLFLLFFVITSDSSIVFLVPPLWWLVM